MNKKIKILCTIGPKSLNKETINHFKKKKVDIFRINMSHTNLKDLSIKIKSLRKLGVNNICIDTEGAQIRTSNIKKKKLLKKNQIIFFEKDLKSKNSPKLYPNFDYKRLKKNLLFKVGFEGLKLKILNSSDKKIKAKVVTSGIIDNNKGVHFSQRIDLKSVTEKDETAIKIAKKFKIKYFALSFANSEKDVIEFRKLIGNSSFLISKIETKKAYENITKIIKHSDSILIDRGDLSRYYPIGSIPIMQNLILKKAKSLRKDCYIATNLLESMIENFYPTRAESNDIFSCLENGAKGLVLAAETAIGNYPKECVDFVIECINTRFKFIKTGKI